MAEKKLDMDAVRKVNETLQNTDAGSLTSNPQECYTVAVWCAAQKAFTGEQMAIAKKQWQDRKAKAYETFVISSEANQTRSDKFGVAVIKDYIAAKCGDYEARYEYCERTNNACGSMERTLVTIISAIKAEMLSHD